MTRVFLENLELVAPHGVYEEERREGRTFRFDVSAELDAWSTHDDPGDILDYRRLAAIVRDVALEGPSRNLIETLAWDIMDRSFAEHDEITSFKVEIRKRATGVDGDPQWVGFAAALDRASWANKRGSG